MVIRVLAVEDSPTQAERLRTDLAAAGFDATVVTRPRQVLELLETEQFHLLLSDVVMPEMDGYELCRAVKDSIAGRNLPIVLLTSLRDPLDVVKGLESGADNFIRKPYQAEQLGARLRTTLHNRELRSTGRVQLGIELSFLDRSFQITAERQQILDLLISTFEELVVTTREVRAREEELTRLHGELEQQLQSAEVERNRLQTVLDSVPVPVAVVNEHGMFSHLSKAASDVFGVTAEDARRRCVGGVARFVDPEGIEVPVASLPLRMALDRGEHVAAGSAFDLFLARQDGTQVPVELQASPVFDDRGRTVGAVAAAHILTAAVEHDPVTRLPTRTAFVNRIAGALSSGAPGDTAVVLLGLDRLDLAAGAAADATSEGVLQRIAAQIRYAVEECAQSLPASELFLAYLGGDQFGVVVPGPDPDLEALRVIEAVRAVIPRWSEKATGVTVTASAGAAVGAARSDASQLLAAAGAALRRARGAGGDRVELFDPAAGRQALERLQLEVDLCSAIERGEVYLQYQPEVDLATGRILGFEALARWRHSRLGPVPPDVFVALAEESTLIIPLGRHVLETACRQAQEWRSAGRFADQVVAVNLSPLQLRPELVDEVVDVLRRTGLPGRNLVLELTESAAMKDPDATARILDDLRALGVRCSLDDFGTGYSSLAHLSRLRFDQLKLDRTFVANLSGPGPDATIAQTVVALGRTLGVRVLAEGVEEQEQAEALQLFGCDQAQGYLFSRPLDTDAATALLQRGYLPPPLAHPATVRSSERRRREGAMT